MKSGLPGSLASYQGHGGVRGSSGGGGAAVRSRHSHQAALPLRLIGHP
ncbi:hypothetical protein E2C01_087364 [Portunus trituberculatus]|uniref:Uncharacterized protein n=1 Tax=Portunus trituberculatus TaxID=210409 RepID=A0A5B7JCA7_PORTR|nr:hypothetical protein [Portunus trituberculatus]